MIRFTRKEALWLFSWPLLISQADIADWAREGVGSAGIVVPWGGHNKVPQTEWLKATEVLPLTVKIAGRLKSSCLQG